MRRSGRRASTTAAVVHTFPAGWVNKHIHPYAWHPSVVYYAQLKHYLMANWGMGTDAEGKWFGKPSYLGFWTAPQPWGPWTQVHEDASWTPGGDQAAAVLPAADRAEVDRRRRQIVLARVDGFPGDRRQADVLCVQRPAGGCRVRPVSVNPFQPAPCGPMRREMLARLGGGFGSLALAHLLTQSGALGAPGVLQHAGGLHHPPKVKRVIQLFMNGGVSQMDTFDYKPELDQRHGQKFDPGAGKRVEAVTSRAGQRDEEPVRVQAARPVRPLGEQRLPAHGPVRRRPGVPDGDGVEDERPRPGQLHDEHRLLAARLPVHGRVDQLRPGQPDRQPADVRRAARRRAACRTTTTATSPPASCPSRTQGTVIKPSAPTPIADLVRRRRPRSSSPPTARRDGLDLLRRAEPRPRRRASRRLAAGGAHRVATNWPRRCSSARRKCFDLSRRNRRHAIASTASTTSRHRGLRPPLPASPAGWSSAACASCRSGAAPAAPSNNWDNHTNIDKELPADGRRDRPAHRRACSDLKSRGLLEDTLRRLDAPSSAACRSARARPAATTTAAPSSPGSPAPASSPASTYGESDEWAWRAARPTYCYDLHATILHLLGIDHEQLTFRHNGIDRRLTDVHGQVLHPLLA